jgi:peptidoglycan/xylan/chitin deacetylase (PgdA/CDA1 family)
MGLRLDRLATLYLTAPFLRVVPRREKSVPILMYHSITDEDESNTHAYYRTKTSPAVFRAQLKWLHDSGYTTCSLAQALQQLQTQTQAADKLVVITFDDGYRDIYQQAFPLLNQYGFSATVFLPTAYIGEQPVSFKGRECLTWAEVRELNHRGILFGSHTVNHPQLRELSVSAVREEIRKLQENDRGTAGLRRGFVRLSVRIPANGLRFHQDVARFAAPGWLSKWRVHSRGPGEPEERAAIPGAAAGKLL